MNDYSIKFNKTLGEIEALIDLPDTIRDIIIDGFKDVDISRLNYTDAKKVNNILQAIKNISHETIKTNYNVIYNQLCILAVSALSALLEDFFISFVNSNLTKLNNEKIDEIDISIFELAQQYGFEPKNYIGTIISKKDTSVNFQDLQSTIRTFNDYFDISLDIPEKDKNYIIFFQQCRNNLAHKGGFVDDKFLRRVNTQFANFKNYKSGDKIQLNNEDWVLIKSSFSELVKIITNIKL